MATESAEWDVEVLEVPQGGGEEGGAGEQVLQGGADCQAGGGAARGGRVQLGHLKVIEHHQIALFFKS